MFWAPRGPQSNFNMGRIGAWLIQVRVADAHMVVGVARRADPLAGAAAVAAPTPAGPVAATASPVAGPAERAPADSGRTGVTTRGAVPMTHAGSGHRVRRGIPSREAEGTNNDPHPEAGNGVRVTTGMTGNTGVIANHGVLVANGMNPAMSGNVRVRTGEREEAMTVPMDVAVIDATTAAPGLIARTGDPGRIVVTGALIAMVATDGAGFPVMTVVPPTTATTGAPGRIVVTVARIAMVTTDVAALRVMAPARHTTGRTVRIVRTGGRGSTAMTGARRTTGMTGAATTAVGGTTAETPGRTIATGGQIRTTGMTVRIAGRGLTAMTGVVGLTVATGARRTTGAPHTTGVTGALRTTVMMIADRGLIVTTGAAGMAAKTTGVAGTTGMTGVRRTAETGGGRAAMTGSVPGRRRGLNRRTASRTCRSFRRTGRCRSV